MKGGRMPLTRQATRGSHHCPTAGQPALTRSATARCYECIVYCALRELSRERFQVAGIMRHLPAG